MAAILRMRTRSHRWRCLAKGQQSLKPKEETQSLTPNIQCQIEMQLRSWRPMAESGWKWLQHSLASTMLDAYYVLVDSSLDIQQKHGRSNAIIKH